MGESLDGRWIRQRRRELDITQEELATLVDCTASMLKKVERGERTLSPSLQARVARVLGAPQERSGSVPSVAFRLLVGLGSVHVGALGPDASVVSQNDSSTIIAASSTSAALRLIASHEASMAVALHASLGDHELGVSLDRTRFLLSLSSAGTVMLDDLAAAVIRQQRTDFATVELGAFHQPDNSIETVFRLASPGLASARPRRAALPFLANATVGRAALIDELFIVCRSAPRRVVAFTGPGGVGKTRVAIEVARRFGAAAYRVVYIDAGPIDSFEALRSQLASAIGLPDGVKEAEFASRLGDVDTLLVIDNAERIGSAVPRLSEIARDADVRVLVTSAKPVGHDVIERTIPPLDVDNDVSDLSDAGCSSVALFIDRARAARRHFQPSPADVRLIARLCERLDGLPLAIELVAARMRNVDDVESLLRSLEGHQDGATAERAELAITHDLDESEATRAGRHGTIDATVAWSLSLLPEELLALVESLGIFPSSFAEEDVVAVGEVSVADAVRLLDELVLRGLAIREPIRRGGRRRWRLLNVVSSAMRRRLEVDERYGALRERYVAHISRNLRDRCDELYGARQSVAQLLLDDSIDDVRVGLDSLVGSADPRDHVLGADLVGRLLRYWSWAGLSEEGRSLCRQAMREGLPESIAARLCNTGGTLALYRTDFEDAEPLLRQALALWTAANDDLGIADTLANLGVLAGMRGDLQQAKALTRQSMERRERIGDRRGLAISHGNLGFAAYGAGDLDEARTHMTEAAALLRSLEDSYLLSETLVDLAAVEERAGEIDAARTIALEAASIASNMMFSSLGDLVDVSASILLADQPVGVETATLAMELFGVAEGLRTAAGGATSRRPGYASAVEIAERLLGTTRADRAFSRGREIVDERALLRRTALAERVLSMVRAGLEHRPEPLPVLTSRELELLRLGSEGLTTQQIGDQLFLSSSTVRTHLQSIYRKLGAANRAAAVRRATELGLL